jgi:hypothetical protein
MRRDWVATAKSEGGGCAAPAAALPATDSAFPSAACAIGPVCERRRRQRFD